MTSPKYKPPKQSTGDTAHLVANALLSLVPGASELFQRFVIPPLEKRREEWMEEVGQALQDLEQNRGINLEDLQSNEVFITVLMQASQMAIRNHQQEKLQALKNAVLNSATGVNIQEDLQLIFIRYIDELTPSHFALLKFFTENGQRLAQAKSYEQLFQEFISQGLYSIDREEFKLLCADLMARVLLQISPDVDDFSGVFQPDIMIAESPKTEGPMLRVTDLGRKLLGFVAQNT